MASRLPKRLAELVPRSEKDPDGEWESIYVDGQVFRRRLPSIAQGGVHQATWPPRARATSTAADRPRRRGHLGGTGVPVAGHVVRLVPHTGGAAGEAMRASNDWAIEAIMDHAPRLSPTAQVSTLDIDDAVDELERRGKWDSRRCFCR